MKFEAEKQMGLQRSFKLGAATVDPGRKTVEIDGETHHLTDLTWRFLMALVDRSPELVTYEALAKSVWETDYVSDETISQRVRQLRQILEDDPKAPTYVRNVRGKGYQLIAKIEEYSEPPAKPHSITPRRGIFVGIGFVVIGGLIIWSAGSKSKDPLAPPSAQPSWQELTDRADEYRGRGINEANETAIQLYEKVLQEAPSNQRALIGLSFSYSHKASKYECSNSWADKAAALADQAILNNANSSGAFAARGLSDDARGRVSSALKYYQKSLQLGQSDPSIQSSAAYLLQVQGRFHDALVLEQKALENAKPTYFSEYQIAVALNGAGLNSGAQKWFKRAELLRPDIVFLEEYKVRSLIKSGDYANAIQLLKTGPKKRLGSQNLETIAHLLLGQSHDAMQSNEAALLLAKSQDLNCYACLAVLAEANPKIHQDQITSLFGLSGQAIEAGDEWPEFRVEIAYILAAAGQDKDALAHLDQAFALGYRDWRWLETTPLLSSLRPNPEFKALVSQMKQAADTERMRILSNPYLAPLLPVSGQ